MGAQVFTLPGLTHRAKWDEPGAGRILGTVVRTGWTLANPGVLAWVEIKAQRGGYHRFTPEQAVAARMEVLPPYNVAGRCDAPGCEHCGAMA